MNVASQSATGPDEDDTAPVEQVVTHKTFLCVAASFTMLQA